MAALVVILLLAAAFFGAGGPRALAHNLGRGLGRGLRKMAPGLWRPGVGLLAFAVLIVALAAAVREAWALALGALVAFGVLALTTRYRRPRKPAVETAAHGLSWREAAEILGVEATASASEVRAAHARLIRLAHPDRGGSAGLAARINAARDVLLGAR